jgi:hypothetical protein
MRFFIKKLCCEKMKKYSVHGIFENRGREILFFKILIIIFIQKIYKQYFSCFENLYNFSNNTNRILFICKLTTTILYHHTIPPYYITILYHHTISPYYITILYHHTISPYYIAILYHHTISPYYTKQ